MSEHIHPHKHAVSPQARAEIKGHQALVIWLTGLSGSGKSTIANALELRLNQEFHAHTFLLDGDDMRSGLNADLGFSDADRSENIRRVGHVAKLMVEAGLIVITAFISPFQKDRDLAKQLFAEGDFWEVYVECPLEICQQRDPNKLYQKAVQQQIENFTGLTSPYEVPKHPDLVLPTAELSVDACVQTILDKLAAHAIIKR